jgi:DNA-binding CsgD family transcriptional regulator
VVTLARLVIVGESPERLIREAVRAVATALHADRCEILRLAPEGDRLLRVASCGEGASQGGRDAVPCGVSSVAGYAVLCGAPVVSGNLESERRFGAAGAPRREGPVSALAAPVAWHSGDYGVLVAYAARADAFDARHALSLSRAASLLGGALERLEEREALRCRAEEAERRLEAVVEAPDGSAERKDHGLTDRQLEVLELMANGRSAKQMASELGLSIHTIHSHQRNLYRALGVGSLAGALKRAGEFGLLPSPGVNPTNR